MSLHRLDQHRHDRPQPLTANPVGRLPDHQQGRPHRFTVDAAPGPRPTPTGRSTAAQQPHGMLAMETGHRHELIQNACLLRALAPPIPAADRSHQRIRADRRMVDFWIISVVVPARGRSDDARLRGGGDDGAGRNMSHHHHVRTDHRAVPDPNRPDQYRANPHLDPVAEPRGPGSERPARLPQARRWSRRDGSGNRRRSLQRNGSRGRADGRS